MIARALAVLLLLVPALLSAHAQDNRVFYYPKPLARTAWQPPMKPVTRLADVKARHKSEPGWRELVIHDENSRAFLVQEPAGTKHERRLYPDSPAWWAVLDGRIRFEVETRDRGFEVFEATKGSYVFVPERMLHGFEVVGNHPSIAFEVTLASATPVYPERPATAPPGAEYIPVRLSTGPNPLDVPDPNGQPWPIHFNTYDLAKQNQGKQNWTQEAIRKNRARGNLICGHAGSVEPVGPANRGHFHSDFAEFWVVMLGELRWTFEGDVPGSIVATEGDIVYAPPKTWHAPQFWGKQGLNCRLTSSTYPSANHFYDPVLTQTPTVAVEEITVLCSNGLKAVIEDLVPKFERETKHKVVVKYGLAAQLTQRIEGGEAFDVAFVTPAMMDGLIARGKIAADSRATIARSGLAFAIRAGARKPDVSNAASFTRALLNAKSIAYAKEGASGVLFAALVEKLGIADDLKPKSRLAASGEEVSAAVVNGDAELGVLPLSEVLPIKGAEPMIFPAEVQQYIVMAGGVSAGSRLAAARDLMKYVTGPAALPVIKAKGMEK